jgi:hypothetical protein
MTAATRLGARVCEKRESATVARPKRATIIEIECANGGGSAGQGA